jgi:hypothetical protein
MPKFIVYIQQINQTFIEVTAKDEEDAREIAKEKWRHDWAWPEVMSVETCDPPAPQYRAFASAAEFMPHADRWITRSFSICPDHAGAFRCSAFDDYGIWERDKRTSYSELTREGRKFADDGTPFGVLIETNQ